MHSSLRRRQLKLGAPIDAPDKLHALNIHSAEYAVEIACIKEKNAIRAQSIGLPVPGSRMVNTHGIEWLIDGYTEARSMISYVHSNGEFDLYPLILPQNFSTRLNDFASEIERCTPKAIIPLDTLPHRFPNRAHPGGHSVDHISDPNRILLYTDAATVSETLFAHELGHIWIDLVQGIEDYRVLRDTSDTARYAQVQFVQSFILDLAVNRLLRSRGFDVSELDLDNELAVQNLATLAESGFRPETRREALFMAQAVASELLRRTDSYALIRANDPLLPIRAALEGIYGLGDKLATVARDCPPMDQSSARRAIDEALRLSFQFTEDPLDFGSELIEVPPSIDWTQDKYPTWLPFQSIQAKCEVGIAMARLGVEGESTYQLRYDPSGCVSVSFTRSDGTSTPTTQLHYVSRIGPNDPDLPDRIAASNNRSRRQILLATERAMRNHLENSIPNPEVPWTRSYSAGTARWLTRVRLEEYLGGEHPYAYAENNPVTFSDPSGLQAGIDPWREYQQGWNRCIQNDIDTITETVRKVPQYLQNPEWNKPFRGPLYPVYGHFCGPQTIDGEKIGDGKPINAVDACCQTHDHCFDRHHCNAANQWISIACRNCSHALCECFKKAPCGLDPWCIAAREGFKIYACSGAAGWGPV